MVKTLSRDTLMKYFLMGMLKKDYNQNLIEYIK
jgi:hypothetical protein